MEGEEVGIGEESYLRVSDNFAVVKVEEDVLDGMVEEIVKGVWVPI